MKDQLFEPYYKRGFNYFILKRYLHLQSPKSQVQGFYLGLISVILLLSFIIGQ